MTSRKIVTAFALISVVLIGALAAAIVFGGPGAVPSLASINDPFKAVDFSDMPPLAHYVAADGATLAYRYYRSSTSPAKGSVVLIHGSAGSSNSMHVLAKALAKAGNEVYALDICGHGASGAKGKISYVGQLEDDLVSFTDAIRLSRPSTLLGFSSGGGFVLRFAGSTHQDEFESYLLLSPFLSQAAPTYRPGGSGWVSVGIPRIIAISILDGVGIHAFNDLPVTRFALSDEAKRFLTPEYSFSLATNFRPLRDYESNIRAVHQPCTVVAGSSDELFYTDKLASTFQKQGKNWPVTMVPGIGHIPLTLDPSAVKAVVGALENMREKRT